MFYVFCFCCCDSGEMSPVVDAHSIGAEEREEEEVSSVGGGMLTYGYDGFRSERNSLKRDKTIFPKSQSARTESRGNFLTRDADSNVSPSSRLLRKATRIFNPLSSPSSSSGRISRQQQQKKQPVKKEAKPTNLPPLVVATPRLSK